MLRGTTIVSVRRGGQVAVAGDGQVTLGEKIVLKHTARKVRRIHDGRVLCGFAGATADAMTLYELLEDHLSATNGQLLRAAVALAKAWRTDRTLRRLEAMLIAADAEATFLISGTGDVLEPEHGVIAIGSGGPYALSAARALIRHTELSAADIARESLRVAAELCVFTNDQITIETIETPAHPRATELP